MYDIGGHVQMNRFLFRFTGKDEEINLNGDESEKPEFGEWTWMTPQQVIEKVAWFLPLFSLIFADSGSLIFSHFNRQLISKGLYMRKL
jgi:8-oxo-dGTP pyrophosphatase MutT (NUDIX family)